MSIRELARRHGVHRRAVRQALASAVPPPRQAYERGPSRRSVPTRRSSARWLDRGPGRRRASSATRPAGSGSASSTRRARRSSEATVRRYVRACRRELGLDRVDVAIVALHDPGDEAQVDFGLSDVILAGVRTQVAVFELRLSPLGRRGPRRLRLRGPGGVPRGPRDRLRAPRRGARPDPVRQRPGPGRAGPAGPRPRSRPSASSPCAPTTASTPSSASRASGAPTRRAASRARSAGTAGGSSSRSRG